MPRRIPEQAAQEVADLFVTVAPDLRRFAVKLVQGDYPAADDLVQEAFHDAAVVWDTLRGRDPGHQRAWLFTVTRNKAISRWKASTRVDVGIDRQPTASLAAPDDTWDKVVNALILEDCWKVLTRMPPTRYRVAYLRWYEQWSTREIAELLAITQDTVRVHLKHVRDELTRVLGPEKLLTEHPVYKPVGKEEAS